MPQVEISNAPSKSKQPAEDDQQLESVAAEDQPSASEEDASDTDN
ncbi:MAG: hypothetical protein WCD76_20935 [Pyrinomonadaceae bacterium]